MSQDLICDSRAQLRLAQTAERKPIKIVGPCAEIFIVLTTTRALKLAIAFELIAAARPWRSAARQEANVWPDQSTVKEACSFFGFDAF